EGVCWPMPGAGERRSLFLLARHGNRDMLAANDLVVGRIKSVPARARNVDFRPSMRGAVLTFAHLDVASDESCPKPPMARAFHHEHREVAACLLLGWSGIVAYDSLASAIPGPSLWLLAGGGILYSFGTLFHLWERLRFHNAIWHDFVLLAAGCHYSAVLACLLSI